VTRAQIRAPFDGEIISPKTRLIDIIDNVKAKIDNVKAKTRNEVDPGPRSRSSLARHHVPDQLGAPPTNFLLEGPPTTSLRLARQVSVSRGLPPTPTEAWAATRGVTSGRGRLHHDAWGNQFPTPCKHTSRRPTRAAGPDRSLNAGLLSCTAIHRHHLQLCRTQASPEALKHPLRRPPAYS
jgi:hypothetical protein